MATIRNRGAYQWQAIVRRRGYPLTSRTLDSRKEAQLWARTVESEMDRGVYLPRNDAERTLLHELIERYRRDVLPSKRGKHFGPALRILDEHLGRHSLAAVTSKVVADFRDARLRSGLSASTVRKEVNLLSRIIDLAGKEWGIALPTNVCKMVSRPKENNARERRLEEGEEAYLLAACRPMLAALVRLALESGARVGELLALRWKDVDLDKHTALVRGIDDNGTKNGDAIRGIPLSSKACAILAALPRSSERVIPNWRGADSVNKPWGIARARARAAYESDCKVAGQALRAGFLENLHFHDLRHEATSRLVERGVFGDLEIAGITGHKTLAMLKRYTHLRTQDLARKLG